MAHFQQAFWSFLSLLSALILLGQAQLRWQGPQWCRVGLRYNLFLRMSIAPLNLFCTPWVWLALPQTHSNTIGPSRATPPLLICWRCVIPKHRHVGVVTNTGYDRMLIFSRIVRTQIRILGEDLWWTSHAHLYVPVSSWHYRLCHQSC